MKYILTALITAGISVAANAQIQNQVAEFSSLFGSYSDSTSIMQNSPLNRGKDMRPKTLLRGVVYFGGSDRKRDLLSSNTQQFLCDSGFSSIYSVYDRPKSSSVSCSGNTTSYRHIGEAETNNNGGDKVRRYLEDVYQVIKSGGSRGPIYLHCWYGVHASNTIAQITLKQFCGYSNAQLEQNWDDVDLYNSLGSRKPDKQISKIRNFTPYSDLKISDAERAAVCN